MQRQTLTRRRQLRDAIIEKYLASGLTQKQFCLQEQLAYSTFQLWLKKYRQANANILSEQKQNNRFVPLTFTPPATKPGSPHYIIEYPNGVVLRVNGSIELQTLIHLIQARGA